jgi:hypothetical protein
MGYLEKSEHRVWGGPTPQQSVQDKANSQQLATQNKPNLSASWQGLRTDVRNKANLPGGGIAASLHSSQRHEQTGGDCAKQTQLAGEPNEG